MTEVLHKIAGYTLELDAPYCDVSVYIKGTRYQASLALLQDGGEMENFDASKTHKPDAMAINRMVEWAEARGW